MVKGVAEGWTNTPLLYLVHHPSSSLSNPPSGPPLFPSHCSDLIQFICNAVTEIDTNLIAPYVTLLINPMTRFISVRGMEVEGGFGGEAGESGMGSSMAVPTDGGGGDLGTNYEDA